MERNEIAHPSEESNAMIPRVCQPKDVMVCIAEEHQVLIVYREKLPGVGSHYAGLKCNERIYSCVARPYSNLDEAMHTYDLLLSCKHPNLLCPLGLWSCEDKDGSTKTEEEKKEGLKEEEIRAFITFPIFSGALMDIQRDEILIVEDDSPQCQAFGFTHQGSKLFCDIFKFVEFINGLYGASFPLIPLRINSNRIVYKKVAEGQYQVFVWADFFINLPVHMRRKTKSGKPIDPTVDDIRTANWNFIGKCLKDFLKTWDVTPNVELMHLATALNSKAPNYGDLMWEPGLWSVNIKIHFIREVYWCIDNQSAREGLLKSKASLGLEGCILKLRFTLQDENLLDSIMFLRKKIVAHQDDLYSYGGEKADLGRHNRIIEIEIQKEKPDYMLKLVKELRQLNWIEISPALRSSTAYIEHFKSE
ncbi:hypothetical protein ACP70R_002485 [Stipagrostis hirtigluma subsp. patula]